MSTYTYKFIPNASAREAFNLTGAYRGESPAAALQAAIGEENCDRYMVERDPLGLKGSAPVEILLNGEDLNPRAHRYETIGTMYRMRP
jgi:hypothetical protein